jgi:tripartite-type tricarboxylate transporter receptor subunit TctC
MHFKSKDHAWVQNALLALMLMLSPFAIASDAYPNKPVRIVIPFGPGSVTDVLARFVADEYRQALGGIFLVEPRPGASGLIASQAVSRASPDGYTLLLGTNTTHAANLFLFKSLPYHPLKDFTQIARLTMGQQILVIHPSVPTTTVKGLMELARKRPDDFSYASSNSTNHITTELLNSQAGTSILRVPFKNSTDAYTAIVTGQIPMGFGDHVNTVPLIKSGRIRALAVTGMSRSRILTDIPTLTEAGFPGSLNNWAGLAGPAGMPDAVVNRLSEAAMVFLKKAEMVSRIRSIGYEPFPADSREFREFLAIDLERWRDAITRAKIQPE